MHGRLYIQQGAGFRLRVREDFSEEVAFHGQLKDEELVRRKVGGKVLQERKQCDRDVEEGVYLQGLEKESPQKGGASCREVARRG